MDDFPEALEQLAARLATLESRVAALEHPAPAPLPQSAPQPAALPAASAAEPLPFAQTGGIFSVLGKAMLGIAGAYVLRAVAESSSLPRLAVAAVAIAYALLWLVWAARVKAGEWLAATIYACTSALIVGPMLWELTLRFNVLPASMTAGVLGGIVVVATILAWKRDLAPVFWVANLTAAIAALALSVATHDLPPFIATLLVMVLIGEVAAGLNHEVSVRLLAAAATNLAIWALIFIYASPPDTRAGYKPLDTAHLLAPGCLLFVLYAVSVTVRTVLQKRRISVFETGQTLIAFLLAAAGLLYFAPRTGVIVLAAACLALSAATYAALFAVLERTADRRNVRVFATWSAGLLLAGSWLLLPPSLLAACLGSAAVAATVLGTRLHRFTLRVHGLVFLVSAAIAAGLPAYVFVALAGAVPAAPPWTVCFAAACAVVCYAALKPAPPRPHSWRLMQLVPAALAVCALAALLVQTLAVLGLAADAYHVAFIRTLTLCLLALALAFAGSRWLRVELNWIAYATLAFVAAKLLFEDLRHGRLEFIAASIFVFAVTLIAVPRLARMGQTRKTAEL
jgi:hypothetical protein